MKQNILIFAGSYLPSVKAGGPVRSVKNIVDNLSNKFNFYIVAADRDLGDNQPFESIDVDQWVALGNEKVFYTNINELTIKKTKSILLSAKFDKIYLNSFFSKKFSIVPLILKKFKITPDVNIVISPRGQFYEGALYFNKVVKTAYIKVAKIFKLYENVVWHSTSIEEKDDIKAIFGKEANVFTASNLTSNYSDINFNNKKIKIPGIANFIFISRIHPKKNLLKALEVFKKIDGEIVFKIYGPIEDQSYWEKCKNLIEKMKENVKVEYHGTLRHEFIYEAFNNSDFFIFPTLGENYGHVISEAMIAGCPVIISDQTPWQNLEEKNVGFDIPLVNSNEFVCTVQRCVDMNNEEYISMSRSAYLYSKKVSNNKEDVEKYINAFSNQ